MSFLDLQDLDEGFKEWTFTKQLSRLSANSWRRDIIPRCWRSVALLIPNCVPKRISLEGLVVTLGHIYS